MTQLLIIKNHINEIKKFCEQKGINYELYNSSLDYSQLHAEPSDCDFMGTAAQSQQRSDQCGANAHSGSAKRAV